MGIELADILILLGAVLLLTGLGLLDWRLALAAGGLLLLALGAVRAVGKSRGKL